MNRNFLLFVLIVILGVGGSSKLLSTPQNLDTPATVIKKSYDKELNLYQYVLSNNVRVNIKSIPLPQKSTSDPTPPIAFRASFGRGELEMLNKEQSALAYVTNLLFTYGGIKPGAATTADTEFTLEPGLNENLPHLEFSVDPNDFSFKGETKTLKQLKYLLSKMRDYFGTAPTYDEEVLKNKVRDTLEKTYSTLYLSPQGVAKDKVRRLLASGNWKFGYPSKNQAMATTIEQIRSFLEKPLKESYLELSIVGDFDVDACLNAVLQTIGTLPARDKKRPYLKELRNVQFPNTPLEKTFYLDEKEVAEDDRFATVTIYFSTYRKWGLWGKFHVPIHVENWNWEVSSGRLWYTTLQLRALAEILNCRLEEANKNQDNRLIHYHAGNYPMLSYNNYGFFEIHARTKPEEIDNTQEILLNVIRNIRSNGINPTEFEQAIKRILEQFYHNEQRAIFWLGAIDCSQELPDGLRWQRTSKQIYGKLKRKYLEKIAKDYLNPQNSAIIKILPQQKTYLNSVKEEMKDL